MTCLRASAIWVADGVCIGLPSAFCAWSQSMPSQYGLALSLAKTWETWDLGRGKIGVVATSVVPF